MADNVAITAGAGPSIATDDAGAGGHVQVVKLAISTDGSATYIPASSTLGLLVEVSRLGSSSTGTHTQVNSAATDTLLLASNTARLGATLLNDDENDLFVGLGTTTVSATVHTVRLRRYDYYEVPFGYDGQIRGIWAADGSGACRITELT
jgi:hypothetical protein